MNRRAFIKTSLAGAALAAFAFLPHRAAGEEPATQPAAAALPQPNVVVIFVDDMGYADVGAFGCRGIPTPNIDALAREGVRFTNAYCTGALCVPSRAGLLTGCLPGRPAPRGDERIGPQLAAAGYVTMEIGKLWHGRAECSEYLAVLNNTNGRYMAPNPVERTGGKKDVLQEYVTDAIARETVEFIDRNKQRPFFLYLPTTAVHNPRQATPKYLDRFDLKHPRRTYAACLSAVDDAVGVIVAKLRAEKLDRNTLILFASDNGGIPSQASNLPLRDGKNTPYEGGIRTPFIARWPDRLPAGKVYDGTVSMVDVLPTALVAATGKPPAAADGVDLVPYLTGERQGSPHETLVWAGAGVISSGRDFGVVRHGRWKLIGNGDEPVELYDLAEDPEEKNNRMSQHPEITQDLVARRKAWQQAKK